MVEHVLGAMVFLGAGLILFGLRVPRQRQSIAQTPLDFRDLPPIEGRYTLHLCGEQEGDRQQHIRRLAPGERVSLRLEEPIDAGESDIAVCTAGGAVIGTVSRRTAVWLAPIIDQGYALPVEIATLFDDDDDGIVDVQIHIHNVPSRARMQAVRKLSPARILADGLEDARRCLRSASAKKTGRARLRWLLRATIELETAINDPAIAEATAEGPSLHGLATAQRRLAEIAELIDGVSRHAPAHAA